MNWLERSELLVGKENIEKIKRSKILLFGIGGVGGHIAEALARSGVGELVLVDNDTVSVSNLNRQIVATVPDIGKPKVEVMAKRIHDINPECKVTTFEKMCMPDTSEEFFTGGETYVIDAIDTVTAKIDIIMKAQAKGIKVISSMGTGNKLDPSKFEICDIYKTSVCPLARVMRRELKARGVKKLNVLFSTEEPIKVCLDGVDTGVKRSVSGTMSYVPATAGLLIAGFVINDIMIG